VVADVAATAMAVVAAETAGNFDSELRAHR